MDSKLEHNKGFWAATLGADKLRSRVAACFIQQYAYCTYQINNASPSSLSFAHPSTTTAGVAPSSHEPFESSSPQRPRTGTTTTAPSSASSAALANAKPGVGQILAAWKTVATSSSSSLNLPPPRVVSAAQRKHQLRNSPPNSQLHQQNYNKSNSQGALSPATNPAIINPQSGGVNNNHNNNQPSSSSHITPHTGKNNQGNINNNNQHDPSSNSSLQTPRNEDFTAATSGKQWRPLLMAAERVFGHAISVRLPVQNRGASACRAAALGETWSAFLDVNGHVRLCGSGAQSLNCKPNHKFTSIAWVGDFIALVDERQDLYVARVSGSSSGLRSGHVLPAFIAPEGQPQKLMENVAEVSGTAAGLLVLNCNGEVFFYSVQKPRQAPLGGIVPYRASSTILLSPQLDIFVLDGLTKMLHKCSIQQHHGRPNTPRAIVSLRVQIKALSAGHRFLCCVDSNGALWVMGWNEVGQLGLTGTDHVRAFQVHEQMSKTAYLTDVACGKRHSCVLSIDGCVYVAGSNKHGQIGVTIPTSTNTGTNGTQKNNANNSGKDDNNNNQGGLHHSSSSSSLSAGNNNNNNGGGASSSSNNNNNNKQADPGFPIARHFYRVPLREKCVAIACGPNASMFAMESFRVFVCGNNEFGQLGLDPCLSINPGQVPVCVASFGLFGVNQVAEFVKFTDPAYVCSGQGHEFDPNDASLTSSVINVGPDGSVSGGTNGRGRRSNKSTSGGGGCCGGDNDGDSGNGEDGVAKESTAMCSCLIQ